MHYATVVLGNIRYLFIPAFESIQRRVWRMFMALSSVS